MSFARPPQPTREETIARRQTPKQAATVKPLTRGVIGGRTTAAAPKERPVESEPYRRLVAKLPCIHCCVTGYSQAAHPNTGKGMGTKTDDRDCFPLCCDRPGVRGCHTKFDQGALFTKEKRRELEPLWGAQTRTVIDGMGWWPQGLPRLESSHGGA